MAMRVLYGSVAMALAMEDSLLDETVLIQLKTQQKVQKVGAKMPFNFLANAGHLANHFRSVSPQLLRAKTMKLQALSAKKQDPNYMPAGAGAEYWNEEPMEECAPGCPKVWIGDGICDYSCEVEQCQHDLDDCNQPPFDASATDPEYYQPPAECAPGCPEMWMGDGICDPTCLNEECGQDMGDCDGGDATTFDMPEECSPGCPLQWVGDGMCDHACAESPECEHDHGDCDDFDQSPHYEGPDGTTYDQEEFEEEMPEWITEVASDLWPGVPMDELVEEFENMPPAEQEMIYHELMSHPDAPEQFPNPADFVHEEEEEFLHHQEHYIEAEVAAGMTPPTGMENATALPTNPILRAQRSPKPGSNRMKSATGQAKYGSVTTNPAAKGR